MNTINIRYLIRQDLPEVLQIEKASFDLPWEEDDFLHCLRQYNCIGMVAEQGEKIVGYMIYELCKSKINVLNFAVHPDYRRQSIGIQMITKLVSKLGSIKLMPDSDNAQRTKIVLCTRESNLNMHLFLKTMGFQATIVKRGYYEDTGEDAYTFQYSVKTESPVNTELVESF